MLSVAAGLLLLRLLLEGAGRGVTQTQAHAVLLGRGWTPGRNEHVAVLEGSSVGHGARHPRVVRQACVAVARGQEGLLAAVVLRLALGLLGLGGLLLGLVLALALALGRLLGCQACGGRRGGGVIPAELCDFT